MTQTQVSWVTILDVQPTYEIKLGMVDSEKDSHKTLVYFLYLKCFYLLKSNLFKL